MSRLFYSYIQAVVAFFGTPGRAAMLFVLALALSPVPARANCVELAQLETLLLFSFDVAQPVAPDPQHMAQNSRRLDQLLESGDEHSLVSPDHQDLSGAVVLFLHGLEQVFQLAHRDQLDAARKLTNTAGFAQLRTNAINAYQIMCDDPTDESSQNFSQQIDLEQETLTTRTIAHQLAQRDFAAQAATRRKLVVMWMMVLWVSALLGVLGVHYYLLLREAKQRSRHICKVPARLEIMGKEMPGHVTILGRYGNRFVPSNDEDSAQLHTIDGGMYCVITFGVRALPAKTMRGTGGTVGMLFSEAQPTQWVKAQLEHSLVPPKLDLTAKSGEKGAKYRLGKGRLIEPPPTQTP